MAKLNTEERRFPGASHDVNNTELCMKNYKRAQLSRYIYVKNLLVCCLGNSYKGISDGLNG